MEKLQNTLNIMDENVMVLYDVFLWLSWGLTTTQNSIRTTLDLDRSRLADSRSKENDRIGADTDPEYRIDVSLFFATLYCFKHMYCISCS